MSQLLKTEGFILRAVPFQDDDLILTAFTDKLGKVALFARGARRAKSPFGPEIDLLSESEFIVFNAKNIKPLREATLQHYFPRLKANYDGLNAALHGTRLLSQLVHEGQRDARNLRLFSHFLHALDQEDVPVALYELAYKLRLLDNFGVAPHLDGCVCCGKSGQQVWFSLGRGGLICPACHAPGDLALQAGLAQGLNALRTMGWDKLSRLHLSARDLVAGAELLEKFMVYHVRGNQAKKVVV